MTVDGHFGGCFLRAVAGISLKLADLLFQAVDAPALLYRALLDGLEISQLGDLRLDLVELQFYPLDAVVIGAGPEYSAHKEHCDTGPYCDPHPAPLWLFFIHPSRFLRWSWRYCRAGLDRHLGLLLIGYAVR